ncbi:MAG: DNA replication/repair protein RecF [Candidatus Eutrophobiaceae bacterium]
MFVRDLSVTSLRVFQCLTLQPSLGINLFQGENASGKSSLLEALYFISRVKSWRTTKIKDVVRFGDPKLVVSAILEDIDGEVIAGVERSPSHTKIKVNGEKVRVLSKQASRVPLLGWFPENGGALFLDSPHVRRHWLDWSLFHVKPGFLETWNRYYRALRHRNALLRQQSLQAQRGGLDFWENDLVCQAECLDILRREYLGEMKMDLNQSMEDLLEGEVDLVYRSGWDSKQELQSVLFASREDDFNRGFTFWGPHRADVAFFIKGATVATQLSRGQMKLYGMGLLVSQARLMKKKTKRMPIMLIDDMDAELDDRAQERLLRVFADLGAQSFMTVLKPLKKQFLNDLGETRMFHVKKGTVEVLQ